MNHLPAPPPPPPPPPAQKQPVVLAPAKRERESFAPAASAKSRPRRPDIEGGAEVLNLVRDLSEDDWRFLTLDIIGWMRKSEALSREQREKPEEAASWATDLLRTKTSSAEVRMEVSVFLEDATSHFLSWLEGHLKGPWLKARNAKAGAKPKKAARPSGLKAQLVPRV